MTQRNRKSAVRSISDYMTTAAFVGVMLFFVAWVERHTAHEVAGLARVIDGDSLVMDGQKVRLVGIDAPELDQTCQGQEGAFPCGIQAREHLRSLFGKNDPIECLSEGDDKYGRLLAECFVDGVSLNQMMVGDGWAISYGGFGWMERSAREEKLGLWAGEFDDPADWRAQNGGIGEAESGAILRSLWRRGKSWLAAFGDS